MEDETYIDKIVCDNLIPDLEYCFRKKCLGQVAIITRSSNPHDYLRIKIINADDMKVKFEGTLHEFCVIEERNNENSIDIGWITKIYISFLNKKFKGYADDYRKYMEKITENNLGLSD